MPTRAGAGPGGALPATLKGESPRGRTSHQPDPSERRLHVQRFHPPHRPQVRRRRGSRGTRRRRTQGAERASRGGAGFSPPSGGPTTSAWNGIELPIAASPSGAPQSAAGAESPFNGRALFYTGQYGAYQYGMNSSSSTTYQMTVNGAGVNLAALKAPPRLS